MKRLARFLWSGLVGAICCTSLPLSVVAVGWTQRLMQRATLRAWHGASGLDRPFDRFIGEAEQTREHESPPRWVLGARPRRAWRAWLGSLGVNVKLGLAVTLNTWVLTLPGAALWLFAWYDGWNNSFHKGYEQAAVGPLTGLLGVALFIAAMLYVPLAQARQAATGRWRSFYEFGLVSLLIRVRWASCVKLAGLYALLSVPVSILKTAPLVFDRFPGYASWSGAAALEVVDQYFFWSGALVFGAYVWLRLRAARIYAAGVVEAVRRGLLGEEQLGAIERSALGRLELLRAEPPAAGHPVTRAVGRMAGLGARTVAISVAVALWFAFVAQIFVSEFLNFHPLVGWLNQPLVQLPWFRYVPPGLGS